jgi:cysteine-rich repeat protein
MKRRARGVTTAGLLMKSIVFRVLGIAVAVPIAASCGVPTAGTASVDAGTDDAWSGASIDAADSSHPGPAADARPADASDETPAAKADASDSSLADAAPEASVDATMDGAPEAGGDSGPDATVDAAPEGGGSQQCGNGIVEGTEQCDDGNLLDLDGCDSSCNYEIVTRITSFSIQQTAGPAFCVPAVNSVGTQVFTGAAINQLNPTIQSLITNGTMNTMFQFLGLADPTGQNASGFTIGILGAAPDPAKGAWPAAGNPEDWWFLGDPAGLAMGLPSSRLANGVTVAGALTAGPGSVTVPLFTGATMNHAMIAATISVQPAPNPPALPPAQLAPGFTVFQTISALGAAQGICGNLTVDSLASIPVPDGFATGGQAACGACPGSSTYTSCGGGPVGPTCNSLLDVMVGGCKVFGCFTAAANPTQPDVPAVSGGTIRTLTPVAATHKVPTSQTQGNLDAYSIYLNFEANRAHFTGQTCASAAECQTGQTCSASGMCQ